MIKIALAVCLSKESFMAKRIQLVCNNMAVVHILNSENAKAESIIIIVRAIGR